MDPCHGDGHLVLSLAGELNFPGIDAFLSAADHVMNSNTLLLKVRLDGLSAEIDCSGALRTFLWSPAFGEAMLEADRNRNWHNFVDPSSHQPRQRDGAESARWLVDEDCELICIPLNLSELQNRFRWMLCDSFSPYARRYTKAIADQLVTAFINRALEPSPADWCLHAVEPNFLWSTGYYTDNPDFGYFDGGENDSATLMHRGDVAYLLLTNGSP